MTTLSNFAIKFKDKCVLKLGKKDLRMVMKLWKKEFNMKKQNTYN
jgi:hypothetical protein